MVLPELTKELDSKDFHIDATPDGYYAIRILECYRTRASVKFKLDGAEKSEKELFDYMNECQDKRLKELDAAINVLKGSNK